MVEKKLCQFCQPYHECQFKKQAKLIIRSIPPLKRQKLLDKNTGITEESAEAYRLISLRREVAKENECPWSEINLNYPGKRNIVNAASRELGRLVSKQS